jgi:hypothetical protein
MNIFFVTLKNKEGKLYNAEIQSHFRKKKVEESALSLAKEDLKNNYGISDTNDWEVIQIAPAHDGAKAKVIKSNLTDGDGPEE